MEYEKQHMDYRSLVYSHNTKRLLIIYNPPIPEDSTYPILSINIHKDFAIDFNSKIPDNISYEDVKFLWEVYKTANNL